jgi:hypothetical protein
LFSFFRSLDLYLFCFVFLPIFIFSLFRGFYHHSFPTRRLQIFLVIQFFFLYAFSPRSPCALCEFGESEGVLGVSFIQYQTDEYRNYIQSRDFTGKYDFQQKLHETSLKFVHLYAHPCQCLQDRPKRRDRIRCGIELGRQTIL